MGPPIRQALDLEGEVAVTVGEVPFVFQFRARAVTVYRGEARSPDGSVRLSTAEALALLESKTTAQRALEAGRLTVAGRLGPGVLSALFPESAPPVARAPRPRA